MARTSMGAQLQVIGALGPLLVGKLVADWASLGTLMGAYSLAGIVVALPAGILLARFSVRAVLLAGVGLMALGGVLLAMAPDVTTALAGRIVSGIGGTLLTITGAKMVLDRFSGPTVALAMGLMLMAWPFGIGLALLVAPLFGLDWRAGLWASALFCCLAFLLVLLTVGSSPREATAAARYGLYPRQWGPLLGIGLVWASYNATFAVAVGFAPAFLTARGMTPGEAGLLASVIGFSILPLQPFGGALAERSSRPMLVTVLCVSGMALCLGGVSIGGPDWLFLPLFRILAAAPSSLIIVFAGKVLSPATRAFRMGVLYPVLFTRAVDLWWRA
ncbi:MFS transporter [Phreatobacter oligotrophus]|uniref:Putative MFS family arabinose efflux permease n=1 Tax=Phreatobacter oligotrophus TaxID=1122261 RepID=A0A2T4YX42_9HYPH|nr:MFS transporter [Phreatobacter oligotrophus]PTM49888.1 putative MFS family arabinose efflux permease [Phreatobacter oligotrophus]